MWRHNIYFAIYVIMMLAACSRNLIQQQAFWYKNYVVECNYASFAFQVMSLGCRSPLNVNFHALYWDVLTQKTIIYDFKTHRTQKLVLFLFYFSWQNLCRPASKHDLRKTSSRPQSHGHSHHFHIHQRSRRVHVDEVRQYPRKNLTLESLLKKTNKQIH